MLFDDVIKVVFNHHVIQALVGADTLNLFVLYDFLYFFHV